MLNTKGQIKTGAESTNEYLKLIKDKKIGVVVNQTSTIKSTHLVDSLIKLNIKIEKIFAPEHGFRGNADAGEYIKNETDVSTGIPVVSLYGKNKKPTPEQIQNLDIIIFDIQDVGARFYTYISTLHYIMEACAEQKKKLIVFDRPNPNGMYVEGPVLDTNFKSFVGMHPIPVVHGLTVGELAQMINGELWLSNKNKCDLIVIKNKNYTHKSIYNLPIKPSPNLPNPQSIRLYPSLCIFEGTIISVGRGTDFPFQIIGAPDSNLGKFKFNPLPKVGSAKDPLYNGLTCFGEDLTKESIEKAFSLKYIIKFYTLSSEKQIFFNPFFNKLIGNNWVKKMIEEGKNEQEIESLWQKDLLEYKKTRKKYLLYQDFE